jgi:hypothetical protein
MSDKVGHTAPPQCTMRMLLDKMMELDKEFQGLSVPQLEKKLQGLRAETDAMRADISTLSVPQLSSVAAQVLSVACGAHGLRRTTCDYFAKLGSNNPGVVALCAAVGADMTPQQFISRSDAVVETRNNVSAHVTTLAELDALVAAHVRLAANDSIRKLCPHECWVIERYDDVKRAFADKFT